MKLNYPLYLLLLLGLVGGLGCSKNDFTDPDDERFNPEPEIIILNPDETFQVIDHFGASDAWSAEWVGRWPDNSKEPIAKLLFSTEMDNNGNPEGIGLTMWRFNIGEGAGDQADSGYAPANWKRESECFLDVNGNYDWTKQAGSQWFLEKARQYGVDKITAWTNCPPYFMTQNGYTFRTNNVAGFNLKANEKNNYTKHLATVMKHFQDEGYNFVALSPVNETQYEWAAEIGEAKQAGSKAFNSEVAEIVKGLDKDFNDLGVNAEILIPEAGQIAYLYEGNGNTTNQIQNFFGQGSPLYIGDLDHVSSAVAGHSYWLNIDISESIRHRKNLRAKLNNTPGGLEYWQTEYSLLGTAYRQGKSDTDLIPIDYALWLSKIIQIDLLHGDCSGWSFWTAMNNSTFRDHPDRFSLILWKPSFDGPGHTDGTYEDRKNLWAFGNFSRFIRPGMQRISVIDSEYPDEVEAANEFMISAYIDKSQNKIVVVCVNFTEATRSFETEFMNNNLNFIGKEFDAYTTSASQNLRHSTMSIDNVVIPAKSIVTLTAEYR